MSHLHLLLRVQVRHPLSTCVRARRFLQEAVTLAGMQVISGPYAVMGCVPGNEGVSATAILDYSSVCLHEWPYQYGNPIIHFDLYTCGKIIPSVELLTPLFCPLDVISLTGQLVDRERNQVCYSTENTQIKRNN